MNIFAENKKFSIRVRGIIVHQDKILVFRHSKNHDYFALPGGHLEWSETPVEAFDREIIEETGVKPKIGKLLYINTRVQKSEPIHDLEFFFEVLNGEDFVGFEKLNRTHAHEIFEIKWASKDEEIKILPEFIKIDFINGNLLNQENRFVTS